MRCQISSTAKTKRSTNQNPVVTDNGGKLVKGKDYTVAYESNTRQDVGSMKAEGHVARAIITVVSPDYADGTAMIRELSSSGSSKK